ncbi:MAG: DUF1638 domain-containing protein [Candidatus Adiutrix sp.]|jgi:hypothetical protein|nr:DUF1638 domain-containing protein [Candidatus Adiutrix sp.]
MKTHIVACETIRDELISALSRLGLNCPVVWLEGGLHNSPARLRARLAEVLAEADGRCERLLVTLGYCGGGVNGLKTGGYTTVLPLADDCLSLLLGSMAARKASALIPTYYLTAGWLRHESNMVKDYERLVARHGRAKADRMAKLMLRHYRRFGLVDTGVYYFKRLMGRVGPLAERLGLSVESLPGDTSWLDRLLQGPHETGDFLVLPPRTELTFEHWSGFLLGGGEGAGAAANPRRPAVGQVRP